MSDPIAFERLADLATRHLDGRLDAAEFAELSKMLREEAEAAQFFNDVCLNARTLIDLHAPSRAAIDITSRVMPDSNAKRASRGGRTWMIYVAAAMMAIVAGVTVRVFHQTEPAAGGRVPGPRAMALLSDMSADAQFEGNSPSLGADLDAGAIHLVRGTTQLAFGSGAVVDLKAPCVFEMTGRNAGRLTRGGLEAYVRPEAHGFAVEMPGGAKVVDLGTRFSAHVEDDRMRRVVVEEGRVMLLLAGEHAAERKWTLVAGQTAAIDAGEAVTVENAQDGRFWLAAFDFKAGGKGVAAQPYFEAVDARGINGLVTQRGITLHYTVNMPTSPSMARDRGPGGSVAHDPFAPALRDFIFADDLRHTTLSVELSGLSPDTEYRLRWYHYDNASEYRNVVEARAAVYRDSVEPDHLLFASPTCSASTDPAVTGHTDFTVRSDAAGRITLVTGPHPLGRAIALLNALAVLEEVPSARSTPADNKPSSPSETRDHSATKPVTDVPSSGK
ncbi:MAG: hypothetical protein GC162_10200 [Planctomycetes bacterium]|nr:hypothetical protein [Planctomycetota bacterium]